MSTLSDDAIAGYARGAGLSGEAVAIAVAVAIAESGGNPRNHNPIPPDNSYGLWQINMLGSMGPARRAQFGLKSNDDLYDPAINARVMASMSNRGSNWKPWTTYTRGTYKMYLNRGKAASGNVGSTSTVQGTPVSTSSAVGSFVDEITSGATWRVIGLYGAGGLLILLGFVWLFKGQLATATKVAGKVV
jgi:hypothetical protein